MPRRHNNSKGLQYEEDKSKADKLRRMEREFKRVHEQEKNKKNKK